MNRTADIQGAVAPGFEGVRDAFADNFRLHGEKGASLAVYVGGDRLVDLWGGVANPDTGAPWVEDTVGIMYSATKGATTILAHLLAQNGELDFDAPMSAYWPEFAGGGKGAMPVRFAFTHQAGLPYLDDPLTRDEILDGRRVVEVLERQTPIWAPGTAHGYHALTFGWLAGELIRRIKGEGMGEVFQNEIARPLGLDFYVGLPASEVGRVARLVNPPPPEPGALDAITDPDLRAAIVRIGAAMTDPNSTFSRALSTNGALPTPNADVWNDPAVYRSEMPAANGISNARSLAKLYAATIGEVEGLRLLSAATIAAATAEQVNGPDRTVMFASRFSTGFQLPSARTPFFSEHSFGHGGAGGALGFADPHYGLAFGYVQNQLGGGAAGDPRTLGILAALRQAIV